MKCKELIERMENDFPVEKAYDWDNVGLLAGRDDKEIKKIYVALDATDDVIKEAIEWGADMLLTHHPLIFSPLKKINNQNFIANRIIKLIQADISYYAMHTNYDIVKMADLASERLGLVDTKPLEISSWNEKEGLGKIGYLKTDDYMELKEYAQVVKKAFGLNEVKVFGALEKQIRKIAILPGSGKSAIEEAILQNADVLITGDIGHHEGIDAISRGLAILDAGHYGIEHIFIKDMCNYLLEFNEITVDKFEKEEIIDFKIKGAEIKHPSYII